MTSRVRCRVPSNNQRQTSKLEDLRHYRQKEAAKIGSGHHRTLRMSNIFVRELITLRVGGGGDGVTIYEYRTSLFNKDEL